MHAAQEGEDADILWRERPVVFDCAVEFHLMRHHALCEAPVKPARRRSWDRLGDDLAERFPPHTWHPRHWEM